VQPALVAVIVAALVYSWTNGFHDASNSVATSLATGALTPRVALGLAASLNVIGGLFGVSIAEALRRGLFDAAVQRPGVTLILAAFLAAIVWNLVTWWWGMPSSSTHALFGGLAGAGLAAGAGVDWSVVRNAVLLPLLISPVLGLVAAWLLAALLLRLTKDAAHASMLRRFRLAQTISASAVAVGHGLQDAQKTAAVVVVALLAAGRAPAGDVVPLWVRIAVSLALGAGTAFGGWRIIRTVGRRIAPVDPLTGFTAELVAAGALYAAAGVLAVPISTTHVTVASVIGGSATRGLRAIRWQLVRWIVLVFAVTPLVAGALAAGVYAVLA
jgi:PiT family inorganic phosphate transporter